MSASLLGFKTLAKSQERAIIARRTKSQAVLAMRLVRSLDARNQSRPFSVHLARCMRYLPGLDFGMMQTGAHPMRYCRQTLRNTGNMQWAVQAHQQREVYGQGGPPSESGYPANAHQPSSAGQSFQHMPPPQAQQAQQPQQSQQPQQQGAGQGQQAQQAPPGTPPQPYQPPADYQAQAQDFDDPWNLEAEQGQGQSWGSYWA